MFYEKSRESESIKIHFSSILPILMAFDYPFCVDLYFLKEIFQLKQDYFPRKHIASSLNHSRNTTHVPPRPKLTAYVN